jgi:hypothetical protein
MAPITLTSRCAAIDCLADVTSVLMVSPPFVAVLVRGKLRPRSTREIGSQYPGCRGDPPILSRTRAIA